MPSRPHYPLSRVTDEMNKFIDDILGSFYAVELRDELTHSTLIIGL
ncbi:TPA: hypothetical protein ACN30S_004532 [Vibrio campbellii]